MTREEAIRCLEICKKYIDKIRVSEGVEVSKELCMALDMAIKALEQEPCDDCVSRSAVLAIAGDSCLDLDSYEDTKEFCDAIKELPPVTPKREQGEWIYTPERHIVDETDEEVVYETENRCSCSACGHKYGFIKMDDAYCRYCGAEMR